MTKNGRNSATISSTSEAASRLLPFCILLLGVSAHLVEDEGDDGLETGFYVLADGGLWDVGIFLYQTISDLYCLVVKLC